MNLDSKLQIKPGQSIAIINSVEKPALKTKVATESKANVVLVYVKNNSELKKFQTNLLTAAQRRAIAWVAYPKAGQLMTDLNRDIVHKLMEKIELKTVRQIAIDGVWSALRLKSI